MKKYYTILNYGCQMNYADSERFSCIVESTNEYIYTSELKKADLIIFNSCSIRQKAEDRILGLSKKVLKLKENNRKLITVLTGCMARRTWSGESKTGSLIQMSQIDREKQLKKTLPWLDYVIESKEFHNLPKILGFEVKDNINDYLSFKPNLKSKFQVYVPISIGCDHFCTYCIVPFARGKEICRKGSDIINEIKEYIDRGYKDIVLLGQTVNRWIDPKYDKEYKKGMIANTKIEELNKELMIDNSNGPKDFLQLLQAIDNIEGDYWLTFMSSHPNYMTSELIKYISKSKHIRPYIHFALQSGSNNILTKMNRRYDIDYFINICKEMKKEIKGLGLSTDIIVGFPFESESDFNETIKVMRELEFDMAYISEFSPRKGTAASLIEDNITWEEKTRRKKILNDEVLAKSSKKNNMKMVGNYYKCLVEKDLGNNKYLARTGNFKEVIFESLISRVGEFVNIYIESCTPWALKGRLNN